MSAAQSENGVPFGAEAKFAAAHARLIKDPSFQFSFAQPPPPPTPPSWAIWLVNFLKKVLGPVLSPILPYVGWIFLALLAVGLGLILFFIVGALIRRTWGSGAKPLVLQADPHFISPDQKKARLLLEDADRLAAEGRYGEAARLILHRSVADIQQRRPTLVAVAYTSRDIAGLTGLPPAARRAFARIAAYVELSLFAEQPMNADGFARCREAYTQFVFADAWSSLS